MKDSTEPFDIQQMLPVKKRPSSPSQMCAASLNPRKIYHSATLHERGYLACAGTGDPKTIRFGPTTFPGLVLGMLACELYLKSIMVCRGIDLIRSHNLLKLFFRLPEAAQHRVASAYAHATERKSAWYVEIAMILHPIQNAFEDWRYLHEGLTPSSIDPRTIHGLVTALRIACERELNEYDQRALTDRS